MSRPTFHRKGLGSPFWAHTHGTPQKKGCQALFCSRVAGMTTTGEAPARKLTAKGQATRDRIVKAAAELMYEHGAQNTNNEQIRAAAGVSGSQLTRHFPTKESL